MNRMLCPPRQFAYLFLLALPIACVAWTITHEEVFREPREWCKDRSQNCRPLVPRKFFYLFTCEYCFSHYVAAFFLLITRFQMLYAGLARLSDLLVCAGVGRQYLHELLQPAAARHQARERRPSRSNRQQGGWKTLRPVNVIGHSVLSTAAGNASSAAFALSCSIFVSAACFRRPSTMCAGAFAIKASLPSCLSAAARPFSNLRVLSSAAHVRRPHRSAARRPQPRRTAVARALPPVSGSVANSTRDTRQSSQACRDSRLRAPARDSPRAAGSAPLPSPEPQAPCADRVPS